jgi:hypothetical protein
VTEAEFRVFLTGIVEMPPLESFPLLHQIGKSRLRFPLLKEENAHTVTYGTQMEIGQNAGC